MEFGGDQVSVNAPGCDDIAHDKGVAARSCATETDGTGAVTLLGVAVDRLTWGAVLQHSAGVPCCSQVSPVWQHAICSGELQLAASAHMAHADQLSVAASMNENRRPAPGRALIQALIVPRDVRTSNLYATRRSTFGRLERLYM